MSIKEINLRLESLKPGSIVKYGNALNLATDWIGHYDKDVQFLLAENQRLVEALEKIAEREYYDEKYPMKVASEALQAYKLLEKKD